MKKIISIMLLIMLAPMIVLADSSGPSILGYDAVVINKNGAKCADGEGGVIPYNTEVFVRNEYEDKADVENDICYSIYLKDIAPLKKEVFPQDLIKVNNVGTVLKQEKHKIIINNEAGVKLKKGPADAYGEYDNVVPVKMQFTSQYHIFMFGKNSGPTWYYVESDGYKGWIDSFYVSNYSDEEIMIFDEAKLFDGGSVVATIPAGTVIKGYYEGNLYYMTYNGKSGFIESDKLRKGIKSDIGYLLTHKETKVFLNGKTVTTIPKGKIVKVVYSKSENNDLDMPIYSAIPVCIDNESNKCYYYVKYDGKSGFVNSSDVVSLSYVYDEKSDKFVASKEEKIQLNRDSEIYNVNLEDYRYNSTDEPLDIFIKKYKLGKTMPANTPVTSYSDLLIYHYETNVSTGYNLKLINYNGVIGWVIIGSYVDNDKTSYIESITEKSNQEKTDKAIEEEKENTEDADPVYIPPIYLEDATKKENNKPISKSSDTLTFALIGAVLVCVTAVVTALIVNSINKKKSVVKKDETKVETPEKKDSTEEVEKKETSNSAEGEKKE